MVRSHEILQICIMVFIAVAIITLVCYAACCPNVRIHTPQSPQSPQSYMIDIRSIPVSVVIQTPVQKETHSVMNPIHQFAEV